MGHYKVNIPSPENLYRGGVIMRWTNQLFLSVIIVFFACSADYRCRYGMEPVFAIGSCGKDNQ
jgi:hypothetical protein